MKSGKSLTRKLLEAHLIEGSLKPGELNAFKVDQVLMQDATGTMASMQFGAFERSEVKVPFAIVYVDHNMLQVGAQNADDHRFLMTFAARHGIHYSKAGNGICHQVHFERFAKPGVLLLGSDSHTTTGGAMGCLAIGAGGLEIGTFLAGYHFEIETPFIVRVNLKGSFKPWVSAKDLILYMLQKLTVRGGVGKIYEFTGPGLKALVPVTRRATIANMIAELGATAAVFPADEAVRDFLRWQNREQDYVPLLADDNAEYDEELEIDLSKIEPLIACPHSPDNVIPVREVAGIPIQQVCAGSSVNSWWEDIEIFNAVLKDQHVAKDVEVTLNPGSKQIAVMMDRYGVSSDLRLQGVKINLPACGPCVGMGNSPPSAGVSVRTMNRNFKGRSGTPDDKVYLASPATAAATALRGVITDPRDLEMRPPRIRTPKAVIDDSEIIVPPSRPERTNVQVIVGPNIKPPPRWEPLPNILNLSVLTRLPDNVGTGDLSPDGAEIMKWRSDLEEIADYTLIKEDENNPKLKPPSQFATRAKRSRGGCIVGRENYGQGSSREHAALGPRFLGVRAVFAKSFARIHRRNLIHQGIVPILIDDEIYEYAKLGDLWSLLDVREALAQGKNRLLLAAGTSTFFAKHDLNAKERQIVLAGGLLNYLTNQ